MSQNIIMEMNGKECKKMKRVSSEMISKIDDVNDKDEDNRYENDETLCNEYRKKYAQLDVEKASKILQNYFPFTEIKKEQKECLHALKNFQHVLNIMPTGGGKSLVYQLVPVLINGISIVISPLISLIQDQVTALNKKNIVAVSIHSSVSKKENEKVLNQLNEEAVENIKVLYVTPETATKNPVLGIIEKLYKKNKISLIAIDEAHCISTWGSQFRKSYRNLNVILSCCPFVRVYACTATATKMVECDIVKNLGIGKDGIKNENEETTDKSMKANCLRIVRCSFNRPNLKYIIIYKDLLQEEERKKNVYNIIWDKKNKGKTGIVYCFKRETCEIISKYLRSKGTLSLCYHAGLSATARKKAQEKWINGQATVLVATIAFGMGIDRKNVYYIIHYNLPKSIENYYQESGRAGRNGNIAFCYLFFSIEEVSKMAYIIKCGFTKHENNLIEENDKCEKELYSLECVNNMCLSDECIRAQILRHFGETYVPSKKKKGETEPHKSDSDEHIDDNYCCSFCDDPCGTRNRIKACQQKMFHKTDCESEISYDDEQYDSEYENSDNSISNHYKKKKPLYKIASVNKKKKKSYNSLARSEKNASYYNSYDENKTHNAFRSANKNVLQHKMDRIMTCMDEASTNKKISDGNPLWGINENTTLTKRMGITQFQSASTIISKDIRKKGILEVMNELEKKEKQCERKMKHEIYCKRPNLHSVKKIKVFDTKSEFLPSKHLDSK